MGEKRYITVLSNKKEKVIDVNYIMYVVMNRNNAEIHVMGDNVYSVRKTMREIAELLGDEFIQVHRSLLVSVMAIHEVGDRIILSNGETLDYVTRRKKEIISSIQEKQKKLVSGYEQTDIPKNFEEYRNYYRSFENMPFAFTDIEMVFDDDEHALDWIFRYGNQALARLEKLPLEKLIGHSFKSLFANMDSKWLRSYERATLYGEKLEIIDYSPEIDTYLKVMCFPTFPGHCGCILFDIEEIKFTKNSNDAENALMLYLGGHLEKSEIFFINFMKEGRLFVPLRL